MRSLVFMTLAFLFIFGCVMMGSERIADPELISRIQPGVTSMQDVKNLFGLPFKNARSSDGIQEWEYICSKLKASHFIPGATEVLGGAADNDYLTVRFGPDGIVKDYSTGSSGKRKW